MTTTQPEEGFALYEKRMKIEICFRDLKSLLQIDKVMNKSQVYLNKILAMVMLEYAVSLLIGEAIRNVQCAQVLPGNLNLLEIPDGEKSSRWFLFSSPFLVVKQRYKLDFRTFRKIVVIVLLIFSHLVFVNVRT